ncbi:MAG: M48 family peptidase, partial [Blastococcus sp.]
MSGAGRGGARAALVTAVVLGLLLLLVIAVRTPWSVLPVPPGGHAPVDPTAGLSAAQVHRAHA